MSTAQKIQHYIQKTPRGKPFTTSTLMKFGARTAVDQAISRLTAAGKVIRLTRGVYVRPEENRFVGQVLPEPFKVAEAIAKKTNEQIQVSGAEAARQLGLSTQVPAQPIFLTTGQSRKFNLGGLEVTLKHVSRKKIPLPESKAGLAILALWYLGKNLISKETIKKIENRLTSQEFEKFTSSTEYMPAWMSDVVLQYKNSKEIEHV
ncbi:MAG: AbiEi antitoxin N-terminal domain-containing protein [Gammaproteobacteria bacterium]